MAGDVCEFSIDSNHWDELLLLSDGNGHLSTMDVFVTLTRDDKVIEGMVLEVMESPIVAIEVTEISSIN